MAQLIATLEHELALLFGAELARMLINKLRATLKTKGVQ